MMEMGPVISHWGSRAYKNPELTNKLQPAPRRPEHSRTSTAGRRSHYYQLNCKNTDVKKANKKKLC